MIQEQPHESQNQHACGNARLYLYSQLALRYLHVFRATSVLSSLHPQPSTVSPGKVQGDGCWEWADVGKVPALHRKLNLTSGPGIIPNPKQIIAGYLDRSGKGIELRRV